jgi:hypothetical protein
MFCAFAVLAAAGDDDLFAPDRWCRIAGICEAPEVPVWCC